ncbi:MAG: DUF6261 family protein [Tannerellaceae bacterium]|jgi:hypothetical protein|nr:DUF6261 family protein [Tannerellaceae bacterium]
MKVIRFNVRQLRNEEWFEFHTSYRGTVGIYGASNLGIADLYTLYDPQYTDVDRVLQALRKSYYTGQVKEADRKRDEVFRGFETVVKGMLLLPDAAGKEAAGHLYNLIEGYRKSIIGANYLEESASIYNLVQDINIKYMDDVSKLGVADWVDALNKAENEFLKVRKKRDDESRDKPKEELLKLRNEMDSLYITMMNVVDAKLVVDGLGGDTVVDPKSLDNDSHSGEFDPELYGNKAYNFVIAWNEIVKKYHDLLAHRAGSHKKKAGDIDEDIVE